MPNKTYSRKELEHDYDVDDERVEVVCCWHQLYDSVDAAEFDRYPTLVHPDDSSDTITPDFVVRFSDSDYRIIGEICRLPAHDEGFAAQMKQPKLYARSSDDTDVLFLTQYAFAEKNEKRALDEGILDRNGEQIIFVSYVRDGLGGNAWWLFKRASRFRDVDFRDAFVGDWSLFHCLTETLDGVHVPSRRWGAYKAEHPTCNDAPSAIYMACLLWDRVLPRMVKPSQYEDAVAKGTAPVFEIVTDDDLLVEKSREHLNNQRIRKTWVRKALELLADAGRAERKGGRWKIRWGQLNAPREDIRDVHLKLIYRLAPKDFERDGDAEDQAQERLFNDPTRSSN